MAEELPLPELWDSPRTPVEVSQRHPRKRRRMSWSESDESSDPPSFSSDDEGGGGHCSSNYESPRRKNKYPGPWFRNIPQARLDYGESEDVHLSRSRCTLQKYDSGVFLTGDDPDADVIETLQIVHPSLLPLGRILPRMDRMSRPTPEELVQQAVNKCLEHGHESLDLVSKGLTTLPNATIRQLSSLSLAPHVTEGVFHRLEPRIKLYLAANLLTTLPGELFNLKNLTMLTVRDNQLREIPSGIGKLTNLEELNIGQNQLYYLPYEFLNLFSDTSSLRDVRMNANPFYKPSIPEAQENKDECSGPRFAIAGTYHLSNPFSPFIRRGAIAMYNADEPEGYRGVKWKVTRQARTEVRFLDIHGRLIKGPIFPHDSPSNSSSNSPSSHHLKLAIQKPGYKPQAPHTLSPSRAPSLFELALQECSKSSQFPLLPSFIPSDQQPPRVLEGLTKVATEKENGGSKCTVCKRTLIIPRTEWIEWFNFSRTYGEGKEMVSAASPLRFKENERVGEEMVPLLRRGCSWVCLPEEEGGGEFGRNGGDGE